MYRLVYILMYGLSLLPLPLLFVVSDVLAWFMRCVIRYRRKLVRRHLRVALPELSDKERGRVERKFYRWFADYMMETVKLLSASPRWVLRHVEFRGAEQLARCFDEGKACSAMLGHYGNWEMLSTTGLAVPSHPEAVMGLIYHPLHSKVMDRLFIELRQRQGGTAIPKKDILRHLVKLRAEKRMYLFGYIADQSPKWENIHLWLDFLHQDTPVFTGAERIIRKMNDAVFYVDMERPRRGHYVFTFKLMTQQPAAMPENALTHQFFQMLEESIRRQPECYLWTHNRWKRQRNTQA